MGHFVMAITAAEAMVGHIARHQMAARSGMHLRSSISMARN
jgi:hypothetical protein